MSASYWKMVGENIAKGVGTKTFQRLGAGGKLLGRAGAVVGIGFLAYEFVKSYKENIENEPAYREMTVLQIELEKWTSAMRFTAKKQSRGRGSKLQIPKKHTP